MRITTSRSDGSRAGGSSASNRIVRGVLAAAVLSSAASAATVIPAGAAPDPCEASQIARTISTVSNESSEYLDSHPQTNHALTLAAKLQGPQALAYLKAYFDANPKASKELQDINEPLVALSGECRLPIAAPQALQLLQAATSSAGLPGSVAVPAGLPPAGTPPAGTGPLPGPATAPAPGTTGRPATSGTGGSSAVPGLTIG